MRFIKRVTALLCAAVLTAGAFAQTGVHAENTPIPQIKLSVGDGQSTPVYEAGQEAKLQINITNQGAAAAKNVTVAPVLDDASSWPFEIESMNYEQELGDIEAQGNAQASWDFHVRPDVESKSYRLDFTITYDDGTNQFRDSKYIYVKTNAKEAEKPQEPGNTGNTDNNGDSGSGGADEGTPQTYDMGSGGIVNNDPVATSGGSTNASVPRVIVTGFSTEPGEVNAGSNFKLIVHVKNTATWTQVANMLFDFQAPSSGTEAAAEAPAFLPASGSSSVYLESIPAGETRDIAIDLNARADLVQKPYSIVLSMKYENGDSTQYESSSSLAIPVKQAARFEFSEVKLAPETIAVGEEANITCSLYNTGRIKLYNVKAKFQGDGLEGEEIFVGNLESGATGTIDGIVTGTTPTQGKAKYKMIVSYEDEAGKASTVEKEFSLEITPEAAPADMSAMMTVEEEKGFPILPVILILLVLAVIVTIVAVRKVKKKKKAAREEEDLFDEVDRFTEDEHIEP